MDKAWFSKSSWWLLVAVSPVVVVLADCDSPAVEKVLFVANKSLEWHLLFELETGTKKARLPMLPPGTLVRTRVRELFDGMCPQNVIIRAYLFEEDEAGALSVVASGSTSGVNPCETATGAAVFDVFLRDTPRGRGTLLLAQDSPNPFRFDFQGTNLDSPEQMPAVVCEGPEADANLCGRRTSGFVLDPDVSKRSDAGVPDIGVVIWSVFRGVSAPCDGAAMGSGVLWQTATDCRGREEEAGCCCEFDCPGNELGYPLATTTTGWDGYFEFSVLPGVYVLEVFGNGKLFRPRQIIIEGPLENVIFLAEDDDMPEPSSDTEIIEDRLPCACEFAESS